MPSSRIHRWSVANCSPTVPVLKRTTVTTASTHAASAPGIAA